MSRIRNAIVSALVLLVGRGRRRPKPEDTRIVPPQPAHPAAELAVLALLGLSSLWVKGDVLPRVVQRAEDLGFESVWVSEHLVFPADMGSSVSWRRR